MAAEIGVLVVHGMGRQRDRHFADPMILELEARLERLGVAAGTVAWGRGYWADLLNRKEDELWDAMRRDHALDFAKLRRFLLNAFADAVAYRRSDGAATGTYEAIHRRIHEQLASLRFALGDADRPLVILAHSLGSVIASDHVWNEQRRNAHARGTNAFERMETLAGIVTFGSNIPLFTLALEQVEAIAFPPPELPKALRLEARWLNYYDADDVLGWPLRPLSPSYAAAVSEDVAIDTGGPLTAWNPASHGEYWTDDSFTKPVAELIARIVEAGRHAPMPVVLPAGAGLRLVEGTPRRPRRKE